MNKKLNDLDKLSKVSFSNSELPTIKATDMFKLIHLMEEELDNIKPDEKDDELWNAYFGYQAALNTVRKFIFGDITFNSVTGEMINQFSVLSKDGKNVRTIKTKLNIGE